LVSVVCHPFTFHILIFSSEKPQLNEQNWNLVGCLLTDRDKMSNLHRGHSINASYQFSVHLAKRLQRRRFYKNRPIRNKNCLWQPCLVMDHNKMYSLESTFHRCFLPSFSSVHLAEGFQRSDRLTNMATIETW
jgi:hypothetical protein